MNSEWLPAISWEIASPPVIVTSLPLPIGWSLLWGVKGRPSMIWLRDCSTPSLLIIHLFLISRAVSIFTALFSSSLFLSWAVKLLLLLTWTVCLGLSGHLLLFSGFGQLLGRIVKLLLLLTWTVCLDLSGHLLLFSGFGQLLGRIVKLLLLLTWTVCLDLSGHLLLFSGFGQLL